MNKENRIELFENKNIRVTWSEQKGQWYFSIIDIIAVLTESTEPRRYWSDLKIKLRNEGSQLYDNIVQLKMKMKNGKFYNTDVADTEQILRLIQSVPSKKAEPFKLWLAKIGNERIDETYDPEITIDRALEMYRNKGYTEEWISQRLKTIDVRKEFTDELKRDGISQNKDFAILTNILTKVWSGHDVKEYKKIKGLKKENLRDNMTNMELILSMLAETSATEISKGTDPMGFKETKQAVVKGATIAKSAKEQIEKESGKKIISSKNSSDKLFFNNKNN